MKFKKAYIIIAVSVISVVMNFVDAILVPPYVVKSLIKVVLFSAVPAIYFLFNRDELLTFKALFRPKKCETLSSLILGSGLLVAIVGAYLLLRNVFDFSGIVTGLAGSGINAENFWAVSIYISFFNSFLEEFFFRGFAFITLKNHTPRIFAYLFSAFFFSFYHVGMTITWLSPLIFLLELLALMAGGMIFNFLNEKRGTIYPSWFVHMFCNFGINTIGFILFNS